MYMIFELGLMDIYFMILMFEKKYLVLQYIVYIKLCFFFFFGKRKLGMISQDIDILKFMISEWLVNGRLICIFWEGVVK